VLNEVIINQIEVKYVISYFHVVTIAEKCAILTKNFYNQERSIMAEESNATKNVKTVSINAKKYVTH
jgi:hypothetical protein